MSASQAKAHLYLSTMLPYDTAVSYRGVAGAGSDFLGDSAVWVCAFLPVWSASPGWVVMCTLVSWGPPDVYVREGGTTAWLCLTGQLGLGCGPTRPGSLSTSSSISFRGRLSTRCPLPCTNTVGQRPFSDRKVNLPGQARVVILLAPPHPPLPKLLRYQNVVRTF